METTQICLGPQEPPQDPVIFNRKQKDGTYRSLHEYFGTCPICNRNEERLKQLSSIIKNMEQEIFDMTHERGKKGMKQIPKWVMVDSVDKVRHVSSLKGYLADLKEIETSTGKY